ncbi:MULTISPECIES: GNAT family N-acetyltransferase [Streptomyces]|uniref:Acetyltransferase, putative n=1 Tax=Streptomyces globisporus TaxID=1908 RepID=A0ABM9GSF4_STRGL|nr:MULTISPECIES: GNAT family N-acetyltransferase [Streptomyces]RDL03321.1 RimJ/RimL family protein N-acetyltransferase [Streptomyces sp. HB202]UIZ12545.1 GNAT family N-acetyltransferase [Streptomyces sp. R527F]WSU83917.1 GNAT family N-acetyltransferase [Streptomyces globisporus]CAH9414394.1 acetyltransferase, putative [Streptomyces globisporus]
MAAPEPDPGRAPGTGSAPRTTAETGNTPGSAPDPAPDPAPGPEPLTVPSMSAGPDFVLRPWEMSDLPLVREASLDPYIPLITTIPAPYSEAAAEAFVRRQWERAATGAGYPFAIVRSRDRRPVGAIGLWLRELPEGRASLGYWLTDLARGQGVARAALRTVTGWALRDLGVPRLQLYIEPWNTASARIAEDIGFRREGLLRGWQQVGDERRDMAVYALLNNDGPVDGRAVAAH